MLVELKVRKIGNSFGLLLPKEAVAQLKAEMTESEYAHWFSENCREMNSKPQA